MSSEKNGLGSVTADVHVLDVFMYPARRLQLYLCQLTANDSNNTQSQTNPRPRSTEGWRLLFLGLPVC